MRVLNCSLLNWVSKPTLHSANPDRPFRLSEFIAKTPVPKNMKFTRAHRAWVYLTKGEAGYYHQEKAAPADACVMKFFEGVRNICKGGTFDLEKGLENIRKKTNAKEASSNIYHVLKIALREAHQAARQTPAHENIERVITFISTELQKMKPKAAEFEKTLFKIGSKIEPKTPSWKKAAFFGLLFLSGAFASMGIYFLFQKRSNNQELSFCSDSRHEFVREEEWIHSDKYIKEQLASIAQRFSFLQCDAYKLFINQMIQVDQFTLVLTIIPKLPPLDQEEAYTRLINRMIQRGDITQALNTFPKLSPDGQVEAYNRLIDRTVEIDSLAQALETVPKLPYGREKAYARTIQRMIELEQDLKRLEENLRRIKDDGKLLEQTMIALLDQAEENLDFDDSTLFFFSEVKDLIVTVANEHLDKMDDLYHTFHQKDPFRASQLIQHSFKTFDECMAQENYERAEVILQEIKEKFPSSPRILDRLNNYGYELHKRKFDLEKYASVPPKQPPVTLMNFFRLISRNFFGLGAPLEETLSNVRGYLSHKYERDFLVAKIESGSSSNEEKEKKLLAKHATKMYELFHEIKIHDPYLAQSIEDLPYAWEFVDPSSQYNPLDE